jgi:hypothetical protein
MVQCDTARGSMLKHASFFALWTKFCLSRYAMDGIRLNLVVESRKRPKEGASLVAELGFV